METRLRMAEEAPPPTSSGPAEARSPRRAPPPPRGAPPPYDDPAPIENWDVRPRRTASASRDVSVERDWAEGAHNSPRARARESRAFFRPEIEAQPDRAPSPPRRSSRDSDDAPRTPPRRASRDLTSNSPPSGYRGDSR